MATSATNYKAECLTCNKDEVECLCKGYSKNSSSKDSSKYDQEYKQEINEIIRDCHVFQQKIIEQKNNMENVHPLLQQVNQWEADSIEKIKQTATNCRQLLIESIKDAAIETERRLNKFIVQVTQICQDDNLNEIHTNYLRALLTDLNKEFREQRQTFIVQEHTSYINKISVSQKKHMKLQDLDEEFDRRLNVIRLKQLPTLMVNKITVHTTPDISANATWAKNGMTIAGGNGKGSAINQLIRPHGLFVDYDQTIIIADYSNHRIMEWKKGGTNGQVIAGSNGQGNRLDQLDHPTDVLIDKETDTLIICDRGNRRVVRWCRRGHTTQGEVLIDNIDCVGLAMDNQRYLYISDDRKHEVRRYRIGDNHGTLVAGGNGRGSSYKQLNEPRYLFVDQEQNIYVSDSENHRVVKWNKGAKECIVVAGGNRKGNALTQLYWPQGLLVDTSGTIYVVDYGNNRLMHWIQDATEGTVITGEEYWGTGTNQFNSPMGLSWDLYGNLYVTDEYNHRVQRFTIKDSYQNSSKRFGFSYFRSNKSH